VRGPGGAGARGGEAEVCDEEATGDEWGGSIKDLDSCTVMSIAGGLLKVDGNASSKSTSSCKGSIVN
jgi:hypothetical protein